MLISAVPPAIAANGPFSLLRLFPLWVLFACLSGIIVGLVMIRLRAPAVASVSADNPGENAEEDEDEEGTLLKQLGAIGDCLILGDLWGYLVYNIPPLRKWVCRNPSLRKWLCPPIEERPEPEFVPAPSAIPFGPFMVIGFLATVFCGEPLTAWYLAYALPKPTEPPM